MQWPCTLCPMVGTHQCEFRKNLKFLLNRQFFSECFTHICDSRSIVRRFNDNRCTIMVDSPYECSTYFSWKQYQLPNYLTIKSLIS